MKKTLRKTMKVAGIVLLALVAAAFLIPVLFKKQITELVKKEINKTLVAKVDFKDVSLSLFRHFPKISITLDDLSVVGTNEFAKDTLIAAKSLDASVNLISAIKGKDIKVYGVFLESPRIHAVMNKEGKANWDIARPDHDTTGSHDASPSEFKMNLQKYRIKNGYLYYKDETADIKTEIVNFDHEGSGDFTADKFILKTKTKADDAGFIYTSIPYLNNAKAEIDADIQIDNTNSKYTFKTGEIKLNDLKLNAEGFFQLVNDSTYNMDIKFKTPSNEFKDILSLIPGIYKQDFEKIKTNGQAAFNGFVKGTYSPKQMPAYDVNLDIKNGFFQYPDLPTPVKNVQIALHAVNPDGKQDNAVIDISRGHVEMDKEAFDFRLLFKNPETVQFIDAAIKGKLDLANISKFIKLEKGTRLAGLVWADAFARGNMAALQNQQGDFIAGGFLDIKNLFYSSSAFPQPVQNGNIKVQIENSGGIADNTLVNIPSGHVEIGKDPVDFSLRLLRPMSSVDFSGTAKGRFTLDHIKQFVQLEPGTVVTGLVRADLEFSGNKETIDRGEYEKIVLNGIAGLDHLKYVSKDYPTGIAVSDASLGFNEKTVILNSLNGKYLNTNFSGNGVLNNVVAYAMKDQLLTGTLNVSADKMNLNDWMGTDTTTTATGTSPSSGPFIVPANINVIVNAKADKVKYDKVDYKNINGTLLLADETVKLQNVKTDALDGTMTFNGSYSTRTNKKDPAINIDYDVKDISVQKAFYAFNTLQKLMPIGQFLDGKLQSQLSMTGNLNGNMMPDLNTLSGKGNLLLIEGLLKKFAPLEKIASTLQIDELKSVAIKDVKNYIEFANGKVLVKPFNVKVKDIDLQIGGLHGFDQAIDYAVQMKVPRKYLGTLGNSLLNDLTAKAASKGIPVKLGETVDLNITMGGTMTNPTIKTELKEVAGDAVKGMQQQAVDFAKAKVDSTKRSLKDSVNVVKNQVVNDVKTELKNQVFGNKDSVNTNSLDNTKKKGEQTIKNTLNSLFNKKKKQPADSVKKN